MWPEKLNSTDKQNLQQAYETATAAGINSDSARETAITEVADGLIKSADHYAVESRYAEGNGYRRAKQLASEYRVRARAVLELMKQFCAEKRFFVEVDSLLSYLCHNNFVLSDDRDREFRELAKKLYWEARKIYEGK